MLGTDNRRYRGNSQKRGSTVFSSAPTTAEVESVIIFMSLSIGYTTYHFLFHSQTFRKRFMDSFNPQTGEILRHIFYRFVQIIVLGVVPLVLLVLFTDRRPVDYGLTVRWNTSRAIVIALLSAAAVAIIVLNPGRKKLTAQYPQMRLRRWTVVHLAINGGTWALYLLAYELMFRGFMLQVLLPYGVWIAVSVNVALYVLAHIPKGLSEAVGALPFGLLVCGLTIAYGTIWAAFWLHLALALANSFTALWLNPEMKMALRSEPGR